MLEDVDKMYISSATILKIVEDYLRDTLEIDVKPESLEMCIFEDGEEKQNHCADCHIAVDIRVVENE